MEEEGRKRYSMSTQKGGSQSSRLPPRDSENRGNRIDTYRGGRGRGQRGSSWTGPDGNSGRKRDRDSYSQGSVVQPMWERQFTGGGFGSRASGAEYWKCGKLGHRRENCPAMQCLECKGYVHLSYDCPKKKQGGAATATHGTTPHGSHVGGDQRGQPDKGSRRVGTSSATAPTQMHDVQMDKKTNDTSVLRGTIIFESSLAYILFDTGKSASFI